MPPNKSAEDRIRRAVSSREFGAALRLWGEFSSALCAKHARGELTLAELSAATDLCAWTSLTAKCARAHTQRRLSESMSAARAAESYRRVLQS
jgi:hypothetical protein